MARSGRELSHFGAHLQLSPASTLPELIGRRALEPDGQSAGHVRLATFRRRAAIVCGPLSYTASRSKANAFPVLPSPSNHYVALGQNLTAKFF